MSSNFENFEWLSVLWQDTKLHEKIFENRKQLTKRFVKTKNLVKYHSREKTKNFSLVL
jgi:hypothetical protein